MEENNFNPMNVNGYSVDELIKFVYPEPDVQPVTVETITSAGLFGQKRVDFLNRINEIERQREIEEAFWQEACSTNTIDAYKRYQKKFPNGQYFNKAVAKIMMLEAEAEELREELFQTMRERPWDFNKDMVNRLCRGASSDEDKKAFKNLDDVASRFVYKGFKITEKDLKEGGIIPDSWVIEDLTKPAYKVPQLTIKDFGNYPQGRTDIFFLGVPRSGKSSVLAGIMTSLRKMGEGEYVRYFRSEQERIDPCEGYYNALIKSIGEHQFPESTKEDAINFLQMNLTLNNRKNPVTFVELSGEAFKASAVQHTLSGEKSEYRSQMIGERKGGFSSSSLESHLIWEDLGASKILANGNRKLLFFILDYSIISRASDASFTPIDQEMILENALRVFSTDGTGPVNPKTNLNNGCTLSKVDTVAVVVTKSDRMNTQNIDERIQIAEKYIYESFKGFMKSLYEKCKVLGINKSCNYQPYILTFSLGKFHIGETIEFDGTDSERIAKFISWATEPEHKESIFGNIFGNKK